MNDRELVASLFPQLDPQTVDTIDEGWDSLVYDVDGAWIVRVPRRDAVRETLTTEIRLLRELGPALPAPIPRFAYVADGGRAVAYRKLVGGPVDISRPSLGAQLGAFVAALHSFPVEQARALGAPAFDRDWKERYQTFTSEVLEAAGPLLGDDIARAEAMVTAYLGEPANFDFVPRLTHADLGPEHVLATGDTLTGVIDWGDTRVGDPALDLAWALHATPAPFAAAVRAAYGREADELSERALFFHRLSPWYELHYGLFFARPEFVESGLAGVRRRLPPTLR